MVGDIRTIRVLSSLVPVRLPQKKPAASQVRLIFSYIQLSVTPEVVLLQ